MRGKVTRVNKERVNYEVCITYACNLRCDMCLRFIDRWPWPDSHVKLSDIELAATRLEEKGITVKNIKITGGEPLVHPQFKECYEALWDTWKPKGISIHSNATQDHMYVPLNVVPGKRQRRKVHEAPVPEKDHYPYMVSPKDLGMKLYRGVPKGDRFGQDFRCRLQFRCGYGFDAFGFSPCAQAAGLVRLFGWNMHSAYPILRGYKTMCQHCPISLTRGREIKLEQMTRSGEIEVPTPTYAKAIDHVRRNGMYELKRFQERDT